MGDHILLQRFRVRILLSFTNWSHIFIYEELYMDRGSWNIFRQIWQGETEKSRRFVSKSYSEREVAWVVYYCGPRQNVRTQQLEWIDVGMLGRRMARYFRPTPSLPSACDLPSSEPPSWRPTPNTGRLLLGTAQATAKGRAGDDAYIVYQEPWQAFHV